MPSPTRKSKNGKKSKNSNTRKYVPRGPLNDPLFQAMNRGNISWGNLLVDENAKAPAKRKASPVEQPSWSFEKNALENWSMPDLTMRKGIWEHFPVTLVKLDDRDGTERYAIEWHKKHLKEWKEERSASMEEWMEYQAYAEFRLLHALRAHSHKYVIEPPRTKDQIVIIAMAHTGPRADAGPRANVAPRNAFAGPVLRKLNDIKEHFPVVWHPVEGRRGKSTYALELFGKKLREMSTAVGHDVTAEVTEALKAALAASNAWHVLPSEGKELCRLEMA